MYTTNGKRRGIVISIRFTMQHLYRKVVELGRREVRENERMVFFASRKTIKTNPVAD